MVHKPQLHTNASESTRLNFTGKCHTLMRFLAVLVGLGTFHRYFVLKDIFFARYGVSDWQFLFFLSLPFLKLAYKAMGLVLVFHV